MNLTQLALKYGSDKAGHHNYTPVYEHYFKDLQHEEFLFIECGIGGYQYPDRGGGSLRMWRNWFTKARIIGIDVYEKSFTIPGVEIVQCSQDSEEMKDLCNGAKIFIDDAGHINPLTVATFRIVWPVIAPGGYYVIEDIESSWCPVNGWAEGCTDPLNQSPQTAVNIGKSLINDLNAQYIPNYIASYTDVDSVHFHKNILVIKKK